MSFNDLYNDKISLEPKKKELGSKNNTKKPTKNTLEPKKRVLEPKNITKIDQKVLDIDALWAELCALGDDFTVSSLLLWLAKIDRKTVPKCDPKKPAFYRTKPAAGVIKLFRHLKQEGYV